MVEINLKVLVSLVPARKCPSYLVLSFSFISGASLKQVFVFFSKKDELGPNLLQVLFFIYNLLLFLAIPNKYVFFIKQKFSK